jgi:hypothetical protein
MKSVGRRFLGPEVVTAVTMKITIFGVVTPFSSEKTPCFGVTYRFHPQGRKVS